MYGQRVFITAIFDGLEKDIHDFYCLKSRQLGITTIIRALCAFFLGVHRGLTGALVFDTNENKNLARDELVTIIKALPEGLKFPGIAKDNRDGLTLANSSKILFKSAGIKKTKTSGTLGRSAGVSLAHLSELCSYDNEEGLVSFRESLSDINPNRLYIYESTARGYNMWERMWKTARKDDRHCICIFIGWWAKDSHRIDRRRSRLGILRHAGADQGGAGQDRPRQKPVRLRGHAGAAGLVPPRHGPVGAGSKPMSTQASRPTSTRSRSSRGTRRKLSNKPAALSLPART